jgi:hypothetical protein
MAGADNLPLMVTLGAALGVTQGAGRPVSLSTRFGRRLAPEQLLDALQRSGAAGVVLDRDLDPVYWDAAARWEFPILAVESPCPRTRASRATLAGSDSDERRTALEAALDTLSRAARLGARFLCLWLGELRSMEAEWRFARERFLRAELDERLALQLLQQRRAEGERPLDHARRALDRLARAAESEGLILVVANGRRFTALPDPRELDLLLADLQGAPVAPLFDVPAAYLAHLMGFVPFGLTQAAFGAAPLVYSGDACGPLGGLAPGQGDLDLPGITGKLAASAEVVFSPWSGLSVDESLHAVTALQKL